MAASSARPVSWRHVGESLNRPYRVTLPMVVLVSMVPGYLVLAHSLPGRMLHRPEIALDRLIPLEPAWALVYGALYLFLIVLPVFVVREEEHVRRTVLAYLMVWVTAFVCFWIYPTAAPRPERVDGGGFAAWGLRFLYEADPPYNCFPSIHVAHSFVSALACGRIHRRLGTVAMVIAGLVAVSTLFARQHYVLDVVAGSGLALAAYAAFLRSAPRERVTALDRRLAPLFALATLGLVALGVGCYWVAYQLGFGVPGRLQ